MSSQTYKSIKFREPEWRIIKDLADTISAEKGGSRVYLPDTVLDAVLFYRDNRPKAAGTPDGQAQEKGVIAE